MFQPTYKGMSQPISGDFQVNFAFSADDYKGFDIPKLLEEVRRAGALGRGEGGMEIGAGCNMCPIL